MTTNKDQLTIATIVMRTLNGQCSSIEIREGERNGETFPHDTFTDALAHLAARYNERGHWEPTTSDSVGEPPMTTTELGEAIGRVTPSLDDALVGASLATDERGNRMGAPFATPRPSEPLRVVAGDRVIVGAVKGLCVGIEHGEIRRALIEFDEPTIWGNPAWLDARLVTQDDSRTKQRPNEASNPAPDVLQALQRDLEKLLSDADDPGHPLWDELRVLVTESYDAAAYAPCTDNASPSSEATEKK